MKTAASKPGDAKASLPTPSDSAKLISLLGLAAGAVAMPQAANADIIYTNLSANPLQIGFSAGFGISNAISSLPGTAQINLKTHTVQTLGGSTDRFLLVSQKAGYARIKTLNGFALPVGAGRIWDQILANAKPGGKIAAAVLTGNYPGSYDHMYLPFEFQDSTAGNALRYGWMEVSLSNPMGGNPDLTLFGYAYDNSGAEIPMGATTPEPSSVALLALGALAFGAAGVRNWRAKRKSEGPKPNEVPSPNI